MRRLTPRNAARQRIGAVLTSALLTGAWCWGAAPPAWATTSQCVTGTPDLNSTVSCQTSGSVTLTLPANTFSVNAVVAGAGGGGSRTAGKHAGGRGALIAGDLTLPRGTTQL